MATNDIPIRKSIDGDKVPNMKIVICGHTSVGKTCLVRRWMDGDYEEDSRPTIGFEFRTFLTQIDGHWFNVQVYDTTGMDIPPDVEIADIDPMTRSHKEL